ncbi:MAG TPA: hypothetical protein VGQ87_00310 [Patescibacteria group bacterium]|jgi:hypothetical protein|nr:hypothetical protein [Patescibacteria group bacterium]
MASKQENVKEVFIWVTNLLQHLKIPYHVTGGLAAIAYGSKRPLYDIDIDIGEADFDKLAQEVRQYLIFGPGNFKDAKWDLMLMTIRYKDVDINISGTNTGKIFDEKQNSWIPYESDLKNTEQIELLGSVQPVISKDILIKYKTILGRPTDLEDIKAITS